MFFYVRAFIAGFVSTLIFHQGLIGLLYAVGAFPRAPYNMAPTEPLGVPSVVSLAFFGGLWAVLIMKFIAKYSGVQQLTRWIIFGAIGPTAVAILVVFPLKGMPFNPVIIPIGLLLNGAWGLGCYLFLNFRR